MSIVIELEAGGRKTGRVCDPSYRNGPGCPLIVRETSEDVLTANVFGVLRRLRSSSWLRPLLAEAFHGHHFPPTKTRQATVSFWEPVHPPSVRATIEDDSEVDAVIRFDGTTVLLEAKYRAKLSKRTTCDKTRDQLIRLLDVGYSSQVADQLFPGDVFVLVIGLQDDEPELVTRYRNPDGVRQALKHHAGFPDHEQMAAYLAQRVGYVSWNRLATLLTQAIPRSHVLEQGFLADVARYIRHRVAIAKPALARLRQRSLPLAPMDIPCSFDEL